MIIACPACRTRYVVPDSAIGVDGRTVRCAKCKHSWFQDAQGLGEEPVPQPPPPAASQPRPAGPGPESGGFAPRAAPPPVTVPGAAAARPATPVPPTRPAERIPETGSQEPPRPAPHVPRTALPAAPAAAPQDVPQPGFSALPPLGGSDPASAPRRRTPIVPGQSAPVRPETVSDERTVPPFAALPDDPPPPHHDADEDSGSSFDHAPPFGPRRNMARLWTIVAVLFACTALGAVGAVYAFGVPAWVPIARPLFGGGSPDLKLEFPVAEQERRTLANGTEFFGARVRVSNLARESRDVPDILIVMRDERERQVYSWVVKPPQARLAPGETMTINEAVTDVPKSAIYADIGWAPR